MTIGDLVVNLGLNTNPMSAGASKAQKMIGGLNASLKRLAGIGTAVGGAIAGLAGIGAFGIMTRDALGMIDSTAKLADSIGISTEALTGLQHAASLSGGSADVMNSALRDMVKNLGEAAGGGGEAGNVLKMMGLSAQELVGMSPDQALLSISSALQTLPNDSQQAAAAMKIFGDSGFQLLPMLDAGADGIAGMMAEADKLGVTFDRFEASRVEQANDAMFRLKQSLTGVAQGIAIGVSPAISWLSSTLTNLVPMAQNSFTFLRDVMVSAFDTGQWAIQNWQEVVNFAFLGAYAGITRFVNQVTWVFTNVIPGVMSWFGNQWQNIIQTWLAFNLNFYGNLGENIKAFWIEIWDFIASAGQDKFEFTWTPLLQGFQSAVREMPEIAEREMGVLEKSLYDDLNSMKSAMGGSLSEFLDTKSAAREIAAASSAAAMIKAPAAPGMTTAATQAEQSSKATSGSTGGPAAMQVDTVEGLRGIFSSQLASTDMKLMQQARKSAQKAEKQRQEQITLLKRIASSEPDEVLDF